MYNFWTEYSLFTNKTIQIPRYAEKMNITDKIYRVREFDEKYINDSIQLGYIPKNICKRTGRANIPNYPVFYGAFSKDIAVREFCKTKVSRNEKIILSTWELNPDRSYNTALLVKENSVGESVISTLYDFSHSKIQSKALKAHPGMANDKEKKGLLWKYLSDLKQTANLFLEDDYFASAIVAYEILYKSRMSGDATGIDAIIYPSIVSEKDINIAIHPSLQDDQLLTLSGCEVLEL